MSFRVVRTNQYNQGLGLIHSTNGNHLESPNEGSSIDHQVTIYLHAQNITMFPTNETWRLAPTNFKRKLALQRLAVVVLRIRSTTEIMIPLSVCTRKHDKCFTDGISTSRRSEQVQPRQAVVHDGGRRREGGGGGRVEKGGEGAATLGNIVP
ncbi:hypothetical protein F511_24296 [Dorcoceras hygrometricum]|uniref:Uncharacterized protein n=1 Tax=Dorcoceras hygrometricum TaxID=472368 RepID=A0A2Z7C6W1_9LAMI|nr:hypothetical protein F511_24296 [Dorcoceras hygrometricum]